MTTYGAIFQISAPASIFTKASRIPCARFTPNASFNYWGTIGRPGELILMLENLGFSCHGTFKFLYCSWRGVPYVRAWWNLLWGKRYRLSKHGWRKQLWCDKDRQLALTRTTLLGCIKYNTQLYLQLCYPCKGLWIFHWLGWRNLLVFGMWVCGWVLVRRNIFSNWFDNFFFFVFFWPS